MRLQGKRAIITGAASGIGRAAVGRFLAEGARVIAVDRPGSNFKDLGDAITLEQDIAADGAPSRIADFAKEKLGGLEVLVNNAGTSTWASFADTTPELWDDMFAVNSRAPFLIIKACLPMLTEAGKSGKGRIINTGSVMSERTDKKLVAYTASKHAIAGLTRSIALEFGPLGITCNFIMPGAIRTGMTKESFDDPKIKAIWEKKSPLRRIAEPVEIAYGMVFLASDEASFITGSGITIDGGLTLRT
jgi:3-oxoacyl-[acyl-carrier protein] reductase